MSKLASIYHSISVFLAIIGLFLAQDVSAQDIWLEAECADFGEAWTTVEDGGASEGQYNVHLGSHSLSKPPSTPKAERITRFTFRVPVSGEYHFFGRVRAKSTYHDSFWLRVNTQKWIKWNNIPVSNGFIWDDIHDSDQNDSPIKLYLAAGEHTLELLNRESDTHLDKIMLSMQPSLPQGLGGADASCATAPAPTPANEAPVALFELNAAASNLPSRLVANGGTSYDLDGDIIRFSWNFGDGTTATGASVQHDYQAPGTYRVVLEVEDNDGASDRLTQNFTVTSLAITNTNDPPLITDEGIWLEAECALVGEDWLVVDHDNASEGKAVLVKTGNQLSTPLESAASKLSFEFSLENAGKYYGFGRVSAPSKDDDSFWVRVNDGKWIRWNNIPPAATPTPNTQSTPTQTNNTSTGGLPVVPGKAGFGINTPAGRGGRIYRVTNLKDRGTGSLRACVEAAGPRVCLFETSGTINLNSRLTIRNPYLTIAGQSAPAPGIAIQGYDMYITTHDVLLQHLIVRNGDRNLGDAITLQGANGNIPDQVVLDHVSMSWGNDEIFAIASSIGEVSLLNCIIAEPLHNSIHPKGEHGFASLYKGRGKLSVVGSYFAHADQRQPLSAIENLVWVNNVHYNRVRRFAHLQNLDGIRSHNVFVGNIYQEGPSRDDLTYKLEPILVQGSFRAPSTLFVEDNLWSEKRTNDPWQLVADEPANIKSSTARVWPQGLSALPSEQVSDWVVRNVGARPAQRDAVDQRLVSDYVERRGFTKNCVSDNGTTRCDANAGGWTKLAINKRSLAIPTNPHGDDNRNGYTNLEEWLHQLAAEVEGRDVDNRAVANSSEGDVGSSEFTWDDIHDTDQNDQPVQFELRAGLNKVEIAYREDGTILDKLFFSKEASFPTEQGESAQNCGINSPSFEPIRINAGGLAYTSPEGYTFEKDQYFAGNGRTFFSNKNIEGTTWDPLYRAERKGTNIKYEIPVDPGTYDLVLHFVDMQGFPLGNRRFDILVEEEAQLRSFDIQAYVPTDNAKRLVLPSMRVVDGSLSLNLRSAFKFRAQLSGIEVLAAGTAELPENTPPRFEVSSTVFMPARVGYMREVTVHPLPVPVAEAAQKVEYSITPLIKSLAYVNIDPVSGLVRIVPMPGQTGSRRFIITANDGQATNNTYSQVFTLHVLPEDNNGAGLPSIRINCGSPVETSFGGKIFSADKYYVGSSEAMSLAPNTDVKRTSFDELYRTVRESSEPSGDLAYKIPVPDGTYRVYLHFAELKWNVEGGPRGGIGSRNFSIKMRDWTLDADVDLLHQAGPAQALVKMFQVKVTGGQLDVSLVAHSDKSVLSAIEVLPWEGPASSVLFQDVQLLSSSAEVVLGTESMKVFPNPAGQQTSIMLNGERNGLMELAFIDAMGRLIRSEVIDKQFEMQQFVLNLDGLAPGIYLLQVVQNDWQISERVIVKP